MRKILPERKPENRLAVILPGIALILLAVILTYLNSFPGAFHYDDFGLFLENPEFREGARGLFSLVTLYAGRPLSILSLELNLWLGGENPFWFHLVNLLLHLSVTLILYFLVIHLTNSPATGLITALLFSLHPLQAQTVNYIWARSLILMSVFLLTAFYYALAGRKEWPHLVLFQLAVWSRMDALAALPLLLLVPRRKKLPLLLLGLLNLAAAGYSMISADNHGMAWNHDSPAGYLSAAPAYLIAYLRLMFSPGNHAIFHEISQPGLVPTAISLCLAVIIVAAVARTRKTQPIVFTGTVWMVLMLLPSLLIPNPDPVNESRAYLAFAGAALVTAVLVKFFSRTVCEKLADMTGAANIKKSATIAALFLGLVCSSILATMTMKRNEVWKDDVKIWREAAALNSESHLPAYNLGIALVRRGEFEEGCTSLGRAIELNPLDDLSYSSLGYCYEIRGEFEKANKYYSRALEINPENRTALESLERPGEAGKKQ